ncbi:MAG: hypothetical protein K5898_03100, partial [Ruminococcus sp.]|uniref:hypothetical protein n=1 Tax=Ruminococcus sp. TaxID=41978 RepID=UPI0025D7DFB6
RAHPALLAGLFYFGVPYLRKNQLKKSLERGSGESLSSERFPPINSISFYMSTTVMRSLCVYSSCLYQLG